MNLLYNITGPTTGLIINSEPVELAAVNMVTASAAITDCSLYNGTYLNKTNKVPNGDFVGTSGWTAGAGWTISGGKATHTAASGTATLVANCGEVANEFYRVSFVISGRTAGSLTSVSIGGTALTSTFNVDATYTEVVKMTNTNDLIFTPDTGFDGAISSVSVYKICATSDLIWAGRLTSTSADNKWTEYVKPLRFIDGVFLVLAGSGATASIYCE